MIFAMSTSEDVIAGPIWPNLHPLDVEESNAPAASSRSKTPNIFNPESSVAWGHEF